MENGERSVRIVQNWTEMNPGEKCPWMKSVRNSWDVRAVFGGRITGRLRIIPIKRRFCNLRRKGGRRFSEQYGAENAYKEEKYADKPLYKDENRACKIKE